jgi:hypothetical protein
MDLEHMYPASTPPCAQALAPNRPVGARVATLSFLLIIGLGMAGCGGKPFIDGRREAGQKAMVGPSSPDRVAICYSSQASTPAEVQAMAKTECAKTNRVPVFDGQDEFQCALLAPTRAYFKCVAP